MAITRGRSYDGAHHEERSPAMSREIRIENLTGLCPVQADGMIDDEPFYFRARGDSWSIEIGPGNTHLVVAAMEKNGKYEQSAEADEVRARGCWRYGEDYGAWPEAGYMPEDEARAFIAKAADLWRA